VLHGPTGPGEGPGGWPAAQLRASHRLSCPGSACTPLSCKSPQHVSNLRVFALMSRATPIVASKCACTCTRRVGTCPQARPHPPRSPRLHPLRGWWRGCKRCHTSAPRLRHASTSCAAAGAMATGCARTAWCPAASGPPSASAGPARAPRAPRARRRGTTQSRTCRARPSATAGPAWRRACQAGAPPCTRRPLAVSCRVERALATGNGNSAWTALLAPGGCLDRQPGQERQARARKHTQEVCASRVERMLAFKGVHKRGSSSTPHLLRICVSIWRQAGKPGPYRSRIIFSRSASCCLGACSTAQSLTDTYLARSQSDVNDLQDRGASMCPGCHARWPGWPPPGATRTRPPSGSARPGVAHRAALSGTAAPPACPAALACHKAFVARIRCRQPGQARGLTILCERSSSTSRSAQLVRALRDARLQVRVVLDGLMAPALWECVDGGCAAAS